MFWMSTSFLLKFQFHMRLLYVKMPSQDRYFKFVMLVILLFLSLLFIAIEIYGFKNYIVVRILQNVCVGSTYWNSDCWLSWSIYSLFFKKILQLYGPEAPFTVHLIAMRGERILFLKDCDCDRNNSKVKHNHSAESHH